MTSINRQNYINKGAELLYLLQKYPNEQNRKEYNRWLTTAKPTTNELEIVLRLAKQYKKGII